MKHFTLKKAMLSLLMMVAIGTIELAAQTATISPPSANIAAGQSQFFTITTTGFGADDNDRNFAYTITGPGATIPATPISIPCTSGCDVETHGFEFPTAGIYNITVTVTQTEGGGATATTSTATLEVWTANLYASSGAGVIRNYEADQTDGSLIHGGNFFTPAFSVDALAKNSPTGPDPSGSLYLLDNTAANGGVVNLYSAQNGGGETFVATADINGGVATDLNFARLGFDVTGKGWIVAGDGTSLYIASFTGNGASPTTITSLGTVTISGPGSINDFQDGDLAIDGSGIMYVVASATAGNTYVYSINDLSGPSFTITRKWTLTEVGGANFANPVNGIAFTQNGSVHLSTDDGLYFIDQNSALIVSGTIECSFVFAQTGHTDLASDYFPVMTILPVKLLSFSASLNNNSVLLNWVSENEQNFDHYEIERKSANSYGSFEKVGNKTALNNTGRNSYSFPDNITSLSDNIFYYRLKMVDADGKFNYTQVILVRKDGKNITGIKINPNPVSERADATLRFNASSNANVSIKVMDMAGRIMFEQRNRITQGTNSITIANIHKLQSGIYLLQMSNGNEIETTRFIISR